MILVLLHEMGHFFMARLFKIRVEKFYVFFNPGFSIWKRRVGNTEYGLGWLPLGGYVKIGGMIDESLDTAQMKREPAPDDFRSKPAWQRILVMSGGVLVNLLLAWLIYSAILFTHGEQYLATKDVTYGIAVDSLGRRIGFESGDRIAMVNGQTYEVFNEAMTAAILEPDAIVTVSRNDSLINVQIPRENLEEMLSGTPLFTVRFPMVISGVQPESAASVAGFQPGDSLLAINGTPNLFFDQFREAMIQHKGETVAVTVARGDSEEVLQVSVPETGIVGVQVMSDLQRYFHISSKSFGFFQSIGAGVTVGVERMVSYFKSLRMIFVPEAKAHKSLGGFISIAKMFPEHWDWLRFWNFTAFLSIILAVMNFLPIPGLDGGHVMFLLYEVIFGRRPSERFMTGAIMLGMIFLLFLVLYANLNDVFRLLH